MKRTHTIHRACLALWLAALPWAAACGVGGKPAAAERTPAAEPALAVPVLSVAAREWAVTIPISGSLRSQSIVQVRTEVGGRLAAVFFEEGSAVQKGQVLAEIDAANYELACNQARAALEVAEAGLERARVLLDHARREKERADNLLRSGGITERDHQAAVTAVRDAETQYRLAEAQCGQARAALAIAEKSLRDCRITAPAAGRVQEKFSDPGTLLSPGAPVCTLVDNTRLELECRVPSHQLAELRTGQVAAFSTPTWGDRLFTGRVAAVSPMVETDNRAVKVIIRIPNPGEELRSGMFGRGEIQVRREARALVIPRSAFISEEQGGTEGGVFVVEEGRARYRPVQLAGSRKDLLWVRAGLREGEQVIVQVGPALKDGTQVRVMTDNSEVR